MDFVSAIVAGLLLVFLLGLGLLYLLQLPTMDAVILGVLFFGVLVSSLLLVVRRAR